MINNQDLTVRKKYKLKKSIIKKTLLIFIIIFIIIFIFSTFNVFNWLHDNKKINDIYYEITSNVEITEIDIDNDTVEINETTAPQEDLYWKYIKMPFLNVDINELKKINTDTIGWIKLNGTNINYPFVQTNDNDYYLNRAFDKTKNNAGWIFLDYRNDMDDLGYNTIIYGHSRVNTTMFGSLKNILKNDWYNNSDNHVVKIVTLTESSLWQVFSVYKTLATSDYIQTEFNNEKEIEAFIKLIAERSEFKFNTIVGSNDKILTLSTCHSDDNYRVVLHAKLIKKVNLNT